MIKKKILSLTKKPLPKSFGFSKKFTILDTAKNQIRAMGQVTGITEDEVEFYITNYESGAPTPEWFKDKIRRGKNTPEYKKWSENLSMNSGKKRILTLTQKPILKKKIILKKFVQLKKGE